MAKRTPSCSELRALSVEVSHAEDLNLVRRCAGGDRLAWEQLVRENETVILLTVRHTLLNRCGHAPDHLVEDVQADVLLSLVKNDFAKLKTYSGRCKLRSWLKIVSNHFAIDRLRKERRQAVSLSGDSQVSRAVRNSLEASTPNPEECLLGTRRKSLFIQLCASLLPEDRRFVEMFVWEGLSFEEIARALQTTVGGVYARKNRVRKKLVRAAREAGLVDE